MRKFLLILALILSNCIDPEPQDKIKPLKLITGTDFNWYNENRRKEIEKVNFYKEGELKKTEGKTSVVIFVKEGESFNLYTKWSNKSMDELLSLNPAYKNNINIKLNDTVIFLFTKEELERFNGLRDAFHASKVVKKSEFQPFKKIIKYKVNEGETIGDILKKFPRSSHTNIEKLNNNIGNLKKGDILLIPLFSENEANLAVINTGKKKDKKPDINKEKNEKKYAKYIIKNGDTAWGVSIKFNLPLKAILSANPQKKWEKLFVGDVILIPEN